MSVARSADNHVRSATLAAATRLFASRGFEGTALQDIADAVGVTKPAVLHHYPSKEHIRQAVLESILDHWTLILPRLLVAATAAHDPATASHHRFDAVFGELLRFFLADPDRARILLREVLDRPVEMHKMLRRAIHPWLSAVAQYVRTGREAGRHHADLDDEAYVLHAMQMVVTATAFAPVTASFVESDAGALLEPRARASARANLHGTRYTRELARMARSSLFSGDSGGGAPAEERRRGKKKERAR